MSSSDIKAVCQPAKSENDTRNYRSFTLGANDLQVLVISDPDTDRSGAAMACGVGSLADYPEAAGLAHFLEHMLFLGTAKYPDESAYAQTVSTHGGSHNAWTDSEETVYYFDVSCAYLSNVLDRFAQFFIAPLFTASATDREMNAVHSEHQKNIYSDLWRGFEVLRQVVKPDHPLSRFHTGDLSTLRDDPIATGVNVRELLLKFHKQYYSANRCKLVVLGRESLDELTQYVLKYFTAVPNYNIPQPVYDTNYLQKPASFLELCPTRQKRDLTITWWLPSDIKYVLTAPVDFISHCVGDEGPGSLLSLLKAYRYATGLASGRSKQLSFMSQFQISISLTPAGLANIPTILRLVYAYMSTIINSSDHDLLRMAQEEQNLSATKFRFKEKSPVSAAATTYASQMFVYPPEKVVQGSHIHHEINLDDIRTFAKLCTLENSTTLLTASETQRDMTFCDSITSIEDQITASESVTAPAVLKDETASLEDVNAAYSTKQWLDDKYYKMRFTCSTLTDSIREYISTGLTQDDLVKAIDGEPSYAKITSPQQLLRLPAPNDFIPTEFNLLENQHEQHVSALPILNDQVASWPTVITDDDATYSNSKTDFATFKNNYLVAPTATAPLSVQELQQTVTTLVQNNIIGFAKQNPLTDSEVLHDNHPQAQHDALDTSFVEAVFPHNDLLPPPPEAPEAKETAASAAQVDDEKSDEHNDNTQPEDVQDEDDEEEDEEEEEEDSDKASTDESGKLFTIESFFANNLETAKQFVPPVQIPVPLPSSAKTFSISQTGAKNLVPGTYSSIGGGFDPILAPISLWYKFTTQYTTPNVDIRLSINLQNLPIPFQTLYVAALSDKVNEDLYPAILCGVNYDITASLAGMQITISGHRESASKVCLVLLASFHSVELGDLERQIDRHVRNYASAALQGSLQQCAEHFRALGSREVLHVSEKIAQFNALVPNLKEYIGITRQKLADITMLVLGNVSQEYAIRLAQSVVALLEPSESHFSLYRRAGNIAYPTGQNIISLWENGNPLEKQGAIINQYLIPESPTAGIARSHQLVATHNKRPYPAPDNNALANGTAFDTMTYHAKMAYNSVLQHIMSDAAFDSLRTKQQLGYIVWAELNSKPSGYGVNLYVQSGYSPQYVDQRVDYFMRQEFPTYLTSKSINSFSSWVANLIGTQSGLLTRWNALKVEAAVWWSHINSRSFDFFAALVTAFVLPYADRRSCIAFYGHYFCNSLYRSKFSVHLHPAGALANEEATSSIIEEYNKYEPQTVISTPQTALAMKLAYPGHSY